MFNRRSLIKGGASTLLLPTSANAENKFVLFKYFRNNLASLVGNIAANFNMLSWSSSAQQTDFTPVAPSIFNTTAFVTFGSSVNSSGTFGPVTGLFAQHLTEDNSNGVHSVRAGGVNLGILIVHSTKINYRISVMAKAAERTRAVIQWWDTSGDAANKLTVGVDLAGGNIGYSNTIGANIVLDAQSMRSLGDGWWLITIDIHTTADMGGHTQPQIFIDNGSGTAAQSTSYIGNGTSGIDLFWFNVLPVGAWNLNNTPAFFDDFSDINVSIDLGQTYAPGYNWYIGYFPQTPITGWGFGNPANLGIPSSFTQSSPSVLKIYNPLNNQAAFSSSMYTVCDPTGTAANVGDLRGQLFQPPFLMEGNMNWNGTFAFYNTGLWGLSPALWTQSAEVMTSSGLGTPPAIFFEYDVVEGTDVNVDDTSSSQSKHQWTWSGGGVTSETRIINEPLCSMVIGQYQRIAGLWLTMATASSDGTIGLFMAFANGHFLNGDVTYTATSPFSTTSWETQHYPIIIDTANNTTGSAVGGWPMYVDWVRLFTS